MKSSLSYFSIPFNAVCLIAVSFPLFGLFICFFSSILTQHDKINEIVCGVQNFIPSISAITGTAPQRYIWRIFIAFHSSPRFVIAVIHLNFYMIQLNYLTGYIRGFHIFLIFTNCLINIIENLCLIGVTYVSSIDNYPMHEKFFITFIVTSCLHMAITIYLFKLSRGDVLKWSPDDHLSFKFKKIFFVSILLSTTGLVYYIIKHRLYCTPNAFSWFSACEYAIGMSNMGFHLTAALDFQDSHFVVAPNYKTDSNLQLTNNSNSGYTNHIKQM